MSLGKIPKRLDYNRLSTSGVDNSTKSESRQNFQPTSDFGPIITRSLFIYIKLFLNS